MRIDKRWVRLAALGVGASVAGVLAAGNQRLAAWEKFAPEEIAPGEFHKLENGWRLHYVEKGAGDAVILLHGFMDSLDSWRHNLDALAARHRVIALDRLGYGFSERVTAPVYSLKQQAQRLREFMEARGILSASVAGHSMGGAVAAQFAYDFPERVNKLIMIASAVYLRMPDTRGVLENIPRFISRGVIGLYSTRHHSIRAGLLNAYGDAQRLREEAVDVRARWMRVRGSADALVAQIASPRESDLPDALARIQAPTLLIWGDRDRVVPLAQGERLRETMPHAQLKVIETAGHIPHEECAAEVNGLMLDFLDQ